MKQGFTKRKCPKCKGNIFLDRAYYFDGSLIKWYEEEACLQCGFTFGSQIPLHPIAEVTTDRAVPAIKQVIAV